jgi:endoglucanase
MLQAVWIDDKNTFDKVWKWTKENLKRPNDHLFGWRWGSLGNNQYGLLTNGGDNSASDADTDIALALILAGKRWEKKEYIDEAKPIITDIWRNETDIVGTKRYLTAGNWASQKDHVIINPSYFAPYAWKMFAKIDTDNDWNSLIDPAYEILDMVSHNNLDKEAQVGLPPDWFKMTKPDGQIQPTNVNNLSTNYSFDAMRIPWRIAIDYQWNRDARAKKYLDTLGYLSLSYQPEKKLAGAVSHDGKPINTLESPAMYATSLGYFMNTDPKVATEIYQKKILSMYSNDTNSFRNDLPYYEENWLWFGTALYLHYIVPFNL